MVYAYVRISTSKQETDNQRFCIEKFLEDNHLMTTAINFVEDTVSGKVPWEKRKLKSILDNVVDGDIIIVSELSRLGRSMLEVMEILSIVMKKGVRLYAIKGNYQLGNDIQSKVLAFAFSLSGEIERELISSRTKEALALRREQGQHLGMPLGSRKRSKITLGGQGDLVKSKMDKGISKTKIAKELGVSRGTLQRYLARRKG
jgi:DNA invertase Pin-like site-specific DNA recombinase